MQERNHFEALNLARFYHLEYQFVIKLIEDIYPIDYSIVKIEIRKRCHTGSGP